MEIFSIKDSKIKYSVFGEGQKPLVIIPGISLTNVLNSRDAVANTYKNFAKDYKVYLFDRTEDVKDGDAIENMAENLAFALNLLGIKNAYVFGASQGGMIAQVLTALYPELVIKAVFGSTAYKCDKESKRVFKKWIDVAKTGDIESLNNTVFSTIYSEKTFRENEDAFKTMAKSGEKENLSQFIACSKACIKFNGNKYLRKINKEILVLGAKEDKVFGGNSSPILAKKLKAESYIYNEYGHAVYDEAPDYIKRILEFMNK